VGAAQVVARHRSHVSNGPTEADDNRVERAKRTAFGFRQFQHCRR
jgi:transposase